MKFDFIKAYQLYISFLISYHHHDILFSCIGGFIFSSTTGLVSPSKRKTKRPYTNNFTFIAPT